MGVKDDRMGEEICACIRLKEGEKTTAEEIKAFCKGKVGASIHPKHHRVAQFSNNLCLPTCQPTAHRDPAQPHALSPSGLQISHFKIPRYIVFVTNYPLTVSGKVCKETREGQGSWSPGAEGQVALPEPPRVMSQSLLRGWQLGHKFVGSSWFALNFPGFSLRNSSVAGKPAGLGHPS